jgi:hypothetical protein
MMLVALKPLLSAGLPFQGTAHGACTGACLFALGELPLPLIASLHPPNSLDSRRRNCMIFCHTTCPGDWCEQNQDRHYP